MNKIISNGHSLDTRKERIMVNQDGNWQENPDGTWSKAIPLPFYGLKKKCNCGKSFWKEENYRKHYKHQHTLNKNYKRTPKGLVEL